MASTTVRRRKKSLQISPTALLLTVPPLVIFAVFAWWPIIRAVPIAFQRTNLITSTWVGLNNFQAVLADPLLGTAVLNTTYFAVLAAVFGFPLPILAATFIAEMRRTRGWSSAFAFIPVVIPSVVVILLWKFFYDPGPTGLFNSILGVFGIPPQPWLQSAATAMPSIVVAATWAAFGSATIIYLATLATIDRTLYEAAEIDGASIFRRWWHISLPQMRVTMLLLLLLQIIGTFQIFTEPFLFTGGGPNNATLTLLMLIYRYAFIYGGFGQATALSLMLAVFLGVLSAIYLLATRRWARS